MVREKIPNFIWRVVRVKTVLFAIFITVFLFSSIVMAQSPLDGLDVNVSGRVAAIAVQTDGKIIIGGSFTQVNGVNRNNLARLNVDRTLDTSFDPNPSSSVYAILIQPNGSILIGGTFSVVGGGSRPAIARLLTDGTLDNDFYAGVAGWVKTIALESSGHILIGGFFTIAGSPPQNHLARLDKDSGNPDPSFSPDIQRAGIVEVRAISVQANGKIIIGGLFSTVGGLARNCLARIDPITGIADSFNPYPIFATEINTIVAQPNGKILVGGLYIGGFVTKKVTRIDTFTGTEDPTFSATFPGNIETGYSAYSLAVQPNGKVLVGGFFNLVNGQSRPGLTRLNTNGSTDTTFTVSNTNGAVWSFAVQSSGKILVGGEFTTITSAGSFAFRNNFAGLEANGNLDKTLDLGTLDGQVRIIAPQPDGKIIIAGSFTSVLGVPRNKIARLHADGSLDLGFDPNPSGGGLGRIFAVALDSSGRVYVGGEFTFIGGQNRQYLARLDPINGAADSFNPMPSDYVLAIHVNLSGSVFIGGGFDTVGADYLPHIAKLDANTGQPDNFFYLNPDGDVYAIAQEPTGRVIFAGDFTTLSPTGDLEVHNRIAKVFADGTVDNTFSASIDGRVSALKLQSNGQILIGGNFTQVNMQLRYNIARLNVDGIVDPTFNPNANGQVNSISIQSNGKIIITGGFTIVGGLPRNGVARLNEATGVPEVLGGTVGQYDPNVNGVVYAGAILPDGKVLIGGDFTTVDGVPRSNFARLTNDAYAVSELTISRESVSWQIDGSSPQFSGVRFELSTDGGATFTPLGIGTTGLNLAKYGELSPTAPQASTYTLAGLGLPTVQDILIRATDPESTIEKVQGAFLVAPTAASVSVSGRVRTASGSGLSNAIVSLTDRTGIIRTSRTNPFGHYRFDDIEAGQTVIISVNAKGYQFQPQLLSVYGSIVDVDFVPVGANLKHRQLK
jgi:uncharacterized delta-60 repeat protein